MSRIAARSWILGRNLPVRKTVFIHGYKGKLVGGFADNAEEIRALSKKQILPVKMTEIQETHYDEAAAIGGKGAEVTFDPASLVDFTHTTPEQLEKLYKEGLAKQAAKEGAQVGKDGKKPVTVS